jgi:predicted Fe-Mo cluster-binding NifX family protein
MQGGNHENCSRISCRDEKAEISPRPGRAPFYLLFDETAKLLEVIPNPFSRGGSGAGFGVAKMLADKGVGVVAGGQFGENMEGALRERGMKHYEMSGSVKEGALRIIEHQEK